VKFSTVPPGVGRELFDVEAKRLARLEHPNIVPVYAKGVSEHGLPFYSMKLVRGVTLQDVIDKLAAGDAETAVRYTPERLLTVFGKLCDAVAFAHAKGFLHRDLKPANVMIGEYGEVLLMDWGIAQYVGEDPACRVSVVPELGPDGAPLSVEGTPQYMSPEQSEGKPLDERTDIYALGGILYALLTLRVPVQGTSLAEVLDKVRSGKLGLFAPVPSAPGKKPVKAAVVVEREVAPALKAVILKAMATKREGRYSTVRALVDDLEAYQHGFATQAEDAGALRLLLLLMRRHKAAAALLFVLLAASVAFTVKLAASESRAVESARIAEESKQKAEESARVAEKSEQKALEEKEAVRRAAAAAQLSVADAAVREMDGETLSLALNNVPADLRDDTWAYLLKKLDTSILNVHLKEKVWLNSVVPDSKTPSVFVTLQADGWIRSVNVDTRKVTDLFQHVRGNTSQDMLMALSPDSSRIAIWSQSQTGHPGGVTDARNWSPAALVIYRTSDGKRLNEFSNLSPSNQLEFSSDGKWLLSQSPLIPGKRFQIFDVGSGQQVWEGGAGLENIGTFVTFTKDCSGLIVVTREGSGRVLETNSGALRRELFNGTRIEMCRMVASSSTAFQLGNGLIQKLDLIDGRVLFENKLEERGLSANPIGIDYLPSSKACVMAAAQTPRCDVVQFWDAQTGGLRQSLLNMHEPSTTRKLLVHPLSGEVMIYDQASALVKAWKGSAETPADQVRSEGTQDIAFLGQPWRLIRHREGVNGNVHDIVDITGSQDSQNLVFTITTPGRSSTSVDRAGTTIALSNSKKSIKIIQARGNSYAFVANWETPENHGSVALSPSGEFLWTDDAVYLTLTGQVVSRVSSRADIYEEVPSTAKWVNKDQVLELAYMKKSEALGELGGSALILWDRLNGARLKKVDAPAAYRIAVSPDGRFIAEGGNRLDRKVRIRNSQTLEVIKEFRAHDGAVTSIEWHPYLPLLVTASEDLSIKMWNTTEWTVAEEIRGLASKPDQVTVAPGGKLIAVRQQDANNVSFMEPSSFR